MPVIIELELRATWPLQTTTRQLHGLACAIFEGDHAENHSGHDKPFGIWPLSRTDNGPVGQLDGWLLRAAWLRPDPPKSVLTSQIRLGHVTCIITNMAHEAATHEELARATPIDHATATFHSPTYFSQNGTDVVTPDPRLIVGSWRRRWDGSLPAGHALAINDEAWRETLRALRLGDFDLHTKRMDSGRGHDRSGFTGTASLRLAKEATSASRQLFARLVKFSDFSGTGAQTTHGFGATTASP
jgi:CRISPR/Cas system endoribonuclease Cas6 (RAMP superfamily)